MPIAVSLQTQSDQTVHMHKVVSTDPDEVRLYCYSEERANGAGHVERCRPLRAPTKLNDLSRPRAHKRLDQVWQRIGRLKAKHSRVRSHGTVTANEAGDQAVASTGRRPQDGSMVTASGRLLPRSSETTGTKTPCGVPTPAPDVEAVFRSLKSELGLRPIPQAGAGRRPPVHHRHRLPARAGHPHSATRAANTPGGPRYPRLEASSASPPPSAARTHAACAHGNPRTRSAGHLRRARRRPVPRRVRKTLV